MSEQKGFVWPQTLEEFELAVDIKNHGNGYGRNIAQWYVNDEWVMNVYESFGSILSPINLWHLLPYRIPDGRLLFPMKHRDVEYDENCIFGEIAASDVPEGCHPYDCEYGDAWSLSTNDPSAASKAAFEMFKRKHRDQYPRQNL